MSTNQRRIEWIICGTLLIKDYGLAKFEWCSMSAQPIKPSGDECIGNQEAIVLC
jgi:hypothetical protein